MPWSFQSSVNLIFSCAAAGASVSIRPAASAARRVNMGRSPVAGVSAHGEFGLAMRPPGDASFDQRKDGVEGDAERRENEQPGEHERYVE